MTVQHAFTYHLRELAEGILRALLEMDINQESNFEVCAVDLEKWKKK